MHDSGRGWSSIRHVASGEIMHSVVEPDVEAAQVYVAQSAFIAQALAGQRGRPLVVWDVGLGAGHNAMALLRAVADRRLSGTPDGVTLISFERDLDAFLLALSHPKRFPHLRGAAAQEPHLLARDQRVEADGLTWSLCVGDFLATFAGAAQPDVVFYDPSRPRSTGRCGPWRPSAPSTITCAARSSSSPTTSTAVRSSLLGAGFHVARGRGLAPRRRPRSR